MIGGGNRSFDELIDEAEHAATRFVTLLARRLQHGGGTR